jgi:hypothetical protein
MRRTEGGDAGPRAPAGAMGGATSGEDAGTAWSPGAAARGTQGTFTTRGASPGLLQHSSSAALNPGGVAQQSWSPAKRAGSAQGQTPISAARRAIRATAAVSARPRRLIVDATLA